MSEASVLNGEVEIIDDTYLDSFDKFRAQGAVKKANSLNNGLELWAYDNCDIGDDESLRNFRGTIFNPSTRQLISYTFPWTHETNNESVEEIMQIYTEPGWIWMESMEGTIVRLYYFDGEWHIATRRRIDAHSSFWGSRTSFGEMFDGVLLKLLGGQEQIDKWYSELDEELTYTFLLSSTSQNRLVCEPNPDRPMIYTGAFRGPNYEYNTYPPNPDDVIPVQEQLFFESAESLIDYVTNIDPNKGQGVFGYNTVTGKFVKILNFTYLNLRDLRGNEADLRVRYLQTMNDESLHRAFREHFDEHSRLFRRLDGSLHKLVRDFLQKQPSEIDQELYGMIDRSSLKSHKTILRWLKTQSVDSLWKPLITRLKNPPKNE